MEQEIPDYEVGLSKGIRDQNNSPYICQIIRRLHGGDPGDTEDPDQLMESVSAHLEDRPSTYYFNGAGPEEPRILVMFQPEFYKMLFMKEDELEDPAVQTAIYHFGFDKDTLQPRLR
jgi:hypothetical protein